MYVAEKDERPAIVEGTTLISYKRKLFLYGGLGNGLNNEIFMFNPYELTSIGEKSNQIFVK